MKVSKEIKIAINGIFGKMGSTVFSAANDEDQIINVAGIDPIIDNVENKFSIPVYRSFPKMIEAIKPTVLVDFTNGKVAASSIEMALSEGINVVSGSTGLSNNEYSHLDKLSIDNNVGFISAPNFAIGAILLMHLAGVASKYFEYADLIESHHQMKIDSPSGTAISIVESMIQNKPDGFNNNKAEIEDFVENTRGGEYNGINIHSARLPGRVARHEVVFGALGQTLTIVHDSINRDSFMPGVMLCIKKVEEYRGKGVILGLDKVLGLEK
ncbi:MAG: 4-hydroxy-tetrahydrodipicolinate reductase [Dehalococcoidia bacterium]